MRRLTEGNMHLIKSDIERKVEGYYLPQTDALEALETHVGNCFAKAMIACGIVVLRHNIEPSVSYNHQRHGQPMGRPRLIEVPEKPGDPRTHKKMEHISVVVPGIGEDGDERIVGIHFGVSVKKETLSRQGADRYQDTRDTAVVWPDFNASSEVAMVNPDGQVVATELGKESGLAIGDWRILSQDYLAAIDRPPLDCDLLIDRMIDGRFISLPEPLNPAS